MDDWMEIVAGSLDRQACAGGLSAEEFEGG